MKPLTNLGVAFTMLADESSLHASTAFIKVVGAVGLAD
jgi:hypothetical protein